MITLGKKVSGFSMLRPKIVRRTIDHQVKKALIKEGVDALLAQIIAARPLPEDISDYQAVLAPKLSMLDAPFTLANQDKAVARLIQALEQKEVIALETDHDCDGQTSHAVLYTCLTEMCQHPKEKLLSFIGHRLEEGYGLSEKLADRILTHQPKPTLVITADNGSSDEPRIARLKAAAIDVIVTDHHALAEEGAPKSALAVLNPTQENCDFPDHFIAGCMVAWLLMAALRHALIKAKKLAQNCMPMTEVLDFVAVGTVADCVSMARSLNNRAVVKYGMKRIQAATRPCWQAMLPLISGNVTAADLGFVIGPLLNSDGRLSDAFGSVNLLLAENKEEASTWVKTLWQQNQQRKAIQKKLTEYALTVARAQVKEGKASIVVLFEEGHAGVHGISSSRIKEQFGRPTILFSEKLGQSEVITGSARSIEALHIRNALATVKERLPQIISFGGHCGAAGITLYRRDFERFGEVFEDVVREMVDKHDIGPVIMTDGPLPEGETINLALTAKLRQLDPYGREFEAPQFEFIAEIVALRTMGANHQHQRLTLRLQNGQMVQAVWFDAGSDFAIGQVIFVVCRITENHFRGSVSLQLNIVYASEDITGQPLTENLSAAACDVRNDITLSERQ